MHGVDGVLITGVYGCGKSSVAAEIAYLLERSRQPFALLDLDYLGWGGGTFDDHAAGFGLMLRNLAAVAPNYRDAGVSVFVVAGFIRDHGALRRVATCRSQATAAGAGVGTRLPTFHAEAAEQDRATSMPDTAWPVNGTPARLIPGSHWSPRF